MASISIIQFKNEAKDYHQKRLDQKEFAIKEHINYVLVPSYIQAVIWRELRPNGMAQPSAKVGSLPKK